MSKEICVYAGEELARYSFGDNHPFGPLRYGAFWNAFTSHGLDKSVRLAPPEIASQEEIEWFHVHDYVEQVKIRSESVASE